MTKLLDILRVSARQVVRQRRRYLGVILAIALGTAGFISVSTMSRDVKKNLNQDLELLGGCTIIKAYFEEYSPDRHQYSLGQCFHQPTIDALRRLPGISLVSATGFKQGVGVSVWRNRTERLGLLGVDEYFWEDRPRYYAALQDARRHGDDLTSWLEYCAEGLELTLERVWTRIQRFSAQDGGEKLILRPRQEQLLHL
ncbi:MAG: ABC transporter permease, partial [Syntrophobacteraceae bacterium]|nr:ABC transporter permease [Syntrophobacteraceae bacterium]